MTVWGKHMDSLQTEMVVGFISLFMYMSINGNCQDALGRISFIADLWSNHMAVTVHWIDVKTILTTEGPHHIPKLQSELVAFYHLKG